MIEMNLIPADLIAYKQTYLFAHRLTNERLESSRKSLLTPFNKSFNQNLKELRNDDWELHKKYVKEGHNPNEIAKIIRNDEIEKLQKISSQENFDFNQKIEPSLYERCSLINNENVTLIDYAAFFGSIQCFRYLLMNDANVYNAGKYAVAGGNLEIIHLCEQKHIQFADACETAIEFHRNDVFNYLSENKIVKCDFGKTYKFLLIFIKGIYKY